MDGLSVLYVYFAVVIHALLDYVKFVNFNKEVFSCVPYYSVVIHV